MNYVNRRRIFALCFRGFMILCVMLASGCKGKTKLSKGVELVKKGDYAQAVKTLNQVLAQDSLNTEIHYNLSLAYAHLDSMDKAMRHYLVLVDTSSPYRDSTLIREMLALGLGIDPYTSSLITMGKINQFKGVFSPGAETLAVAAAKRDIAKISLVNLDGSTIEIAAARGMNTDPDYSAQGDRIVFTSDQDGNEEIYLYDIGGQKQTRLTNHPGPDYSPNFSPDGSEIVFVSNMDDKYKWEIYKMSLKDLKPKRLTNNIYWDGFSRYSADGKSITFSSRRNGSEDIYIMNPNGTGERILYQTPANENDATLIGDHLFFKSDCSGDWEIYRYNLATKRLTRLTNNKYPDWNPRISRDAARLLVARRINDRWQIVCVNLKKPLPAELLAEKIREYLTKLQ